MKKPTVTVLTTVYNREKYLGDCINSVLASTFQDWELIIVDDCSTDNSFNIAMSFAEEHSRIKAFRNEENLGQFENRNYAASLATGDYIKFLDSDDQIYPHGLEVFVDAASRFPNAGLIISHDKLHELNPYPLEMTSNEAIAAFFINGGFPTSGPSATLIKTSVFKKVNGFPKPYYVGTDVLLWLKIANISSVVKVQPALNWYRQHEGQAIKSGMLSNEYLELDYNFYKEHLIHCPSDILDLNDKAKAMGLLKKRQLRKLLKYLFSTGNVFQCIRIARSNRFSLKDLKYVFVQ